MDGVQAKRRPGRKPKGGEKLEQFSIRLPPRLKFGLELLARLQGRSLSQSVEWALQYALSNVGCDESGQSQKLSGLAAVAIKYEGWEQAFWLFQANPQLVKFDERYACKILQHSEEYAHVSSELTKATGGKLPDGLSELYEAWRLVARDVWPILIADADELSLVPNEGELVSLTELFYTRLAKLPIRERIIEAAKQARSKGIASPPLPV